ncbi:beta-ketoacyl synthase N-terminal-like domain-containing protein [Aliarcobacter butzleri]|uniref:beta-ketoacyl synthase N-terminal-like domain-containing protein n=1 Tax=Aliarcobacter butzleri TaxID=28197 RepID=UPI00244CC47C|nr:beta-ketoacyl synthase N-terminal-like domain-containing protein [Aliarcobacter butzleri]MDH1975931.1 beta-ketoacyl synthase [Aliarcobacter butzleri]
MHKTFITGASIICALGNNKFECIKTFENINDETYKDYLYNNFEGLNYYRIKRNFDSQKDKFYSLLSQVVLDAIEDAKLSKDEQKELHIFLASTSNSISILEESFLNKNSLDFIGFKNITKYLEDLICSNYQSTIIHTACTSSTNAIIKASEQIKNNQIKKAIVIGFEFFNQSTYKGFESLMLLSPSGEYKPFDKDSDGLILGEACSAIILETSKKNTDDFEIISYANSFDDHSITSSNPTGEATLLCLENTIKNANLEIKDLTCIKAHATGSENSNLSEVTALDSLFKKQNQKCDIVILKPYIGHTLGACGSNEIILLCESIKNGTLPKTINFKNSYENVNFTPLLQSKKVNKGTVLFHFVGFGGSNASIILSNKS